MNPLFMKMKNILYFSTFISFHFMLKRDLNKAVNIFYFLDTGTRAEP